MKGIRKAQIVKVIKTKTSVGNGTKEDPVRTIVQYWGRDGELICTKDPVNEKVKPGHHGKPTRHQ